ncbi:MAG TPA: NAD(P)-dependent oxidoreductase [Polyangia bacterium]|nr:NAD(P)-dependent oxidoreductase [Polyangia bacterium]
MRILITGGRGTIGQILLHRLRGDGHEVWTCDLAHHHDPQHVRCDVAEFRQLARLFDGHAFELVYHLAAEYGRWNGEDHYEELWRTNVIGTKHILRLQERLGFKLVFTSTSEVYGDVTEPMSEELMDRREVRQLNDYAISKWVNEQQILNSAAMFGTQTVRTRIFNTYGPGELYTPYRSAICRFIHAALTDRPYTVFLKHRRTSIFVSDTVRTLAALVTSFVPGEVYNVGGAESHDMKTVSDLVLGHLGKTDARVTYAESEPFTTRDKQLDTAKAARVLGHRPRVSLEDGLGRTIAWMRRVYVEGDAADPVRYLGDAR